MARRSFTVRRGSAEGGSYVQYPAGGVSASLGLGGPKNYTGSASATYIKGDNVQTAPVLSTSVVAGNALSNAAFFQATATDYKQVTITWGLTLYEIGVTAEPYSVHIVYSPLGCPDTVAEGSVLIETRTIEELIHTNVEGEWAYYTMFIRYKSNNDDYYEPVSKLEVLIPADYGSTESLYAKIPAYYQNQDEIGTGDLKKYLSIFGWDVDKFRTTLDFAISMKDPWVANEETLDYIAGDLGAGLTVSDLGSQRLRDLLTILSNSRKKNGTGASIEQFLEAVVGANVEISDTNKTIKIYSQRVNLVKDPNFVYKIASGLDAGGPSDNSSVVYDAGVVGTTQDSTINGGSTPTEVASAATPTTEKWIGFTNPNNFSHDILETTTADVKVIGGDVLYFSVNIPNIAGGSKDVPGAINNVAIYQSTGISGGSANLIAIDYVPQLFGTTKYWRLVVPSTVTTYTSVKLTIEYNTLYNSQVISYTDFGYVLFERNYIGKYFDGNTVEGGWLLSSTGSGSISDYRWVGTPNNSFSVYTTNWKKTTQVVSRLLKDLLPVRETISSGTLYSNGFYKPTVGAIVKTPNYKYTITYDKIPGDT